MDFNYKLQPYAHQRRIFETTWHKPYRGLFMEQRTGKSAIILYTAAQLHATGRINSLFILAPNGVNRNWLSDEIPQHLPDWVPRTTVLWTADDTQKAKRTLDSLFTPGPELRILSMNIEAIGTKKGFEFAKRFLTSTDCLWAVDESTRIKNPQAVTVKNILKLRDKAKYRRVLNGTPITQGPLDLYSQLLFLSEDAVPVTSYIAFKSRYADFLPAHNPLVQAIMRKSGSRWAPQIIATNDDGSPAYKNLEELNQYVLQSCDRVLRKDCADIPEKVYKRWEVTLPPHHQRTLAQYLDNMKRGHTPEPVEKMTAVMFYQRLLCGLIPRQLNDDNQERSIYEDPAYNPRIRAILDIIEIYPNSPMIIWARFKTDLHDIANQIEKDTGKPVARYWGDISDAEREEAKQGFQAGRYNFFVGQQGAGGVGLPLHRAEVMVYHSNTFSLYERMQSEDRAENIKNTTGTLVIDLEVPNTVDSKIISALRSKKDVATLITGDPITTWME